MTSFDCDKQYNYAENNHSFNVYDDLYSKRQHTHVFCVGTVVGQWTCD